MDPRKFDAMVQRLSESLSRRNIVGGTIGSSLLAAAGLRAGETDDDALAKGNGKGKGRAHGKGRGNGHHRDRNNGQGASAEHKKHRHKKPCKKAGTGCKPKKRRCCNGLTCQAVPGFGGLRCCAGAGARCSQSQECCSGACVQGACAFIS